MERGAVGTDGRVFIGVSIAGVEWWAQPALAARMAARFDVTQRRVTFTRGDGETFNGMVIESHGDGVCTVSYRARNRKSCTFTGPVRHAWRPGR